MSNGKEFQRTDAATENERHPTIKRYYPDTHTQRDETECSIRTTKVAGNKAERFGLLIPFCLLT